MPRVLITGGSGGLGSELLPRLAAAGYAVRILSRRPRPGGLESALEWAQGDIETGSGLEDAVSGAELIVHAASGIAQRRSRQVDVGGTGNLLRQAAAAGAAHLLYISIVGVDRIPLNYYQTKLAAERLIDQSGVPWSILRATQFHSLIDRFLGALVRLPVALGPSDLRFQPIDTGEVAQRMVEAVRAGPAGHLPDIGGPEVLTSGEMARVWLKSRGRRAWIIHLPLPGRAAAGFRRGDNCTPDNAYGKITWEQWLARKYASVNGS